MARVTLLSENTARDRGILGEHGMAYWIDTGRHRVLFDTGQGMALAPNSEALGIDLSTADAIVLSHGHYDHVSGLPMALARAPVATLWMHPAATAPKFIRGHDGKARRISTAFMEAGDFGPGRAVRWLTTPTEIVPGVWATGQVPRLHEIEDTGGPFFLDEAASLPDPILDDLALYLPGPDGLTVLLGCAHAGAINTLEFILLQIGGAPIRALVGGLHLAAAGEERVAWTVDALRRLRVARMGFCHCTGWRAVRRLQSAFPQESFEACAGWRMEISQP
jgi:7,8-dihydropterin-6-yl-methyl-4-(beta-D-ribofuranosyl)aminobenzene 5'-phosphate synthase